MILKRTLSGMCLLLILGLMLQGNWSKNAPAADEDEKIEHINAARRSGLYTSEVNAAVKRGLRYLKESQNANGSWGVRCKVAATAKAGLAILANGCSTNRGKYAKSLKRAIQYFLDIQQDNGYYSDNASRMHGQGYASMFMAEAYGMSNSGSLKSPDDFTKKIKRSLDLAVDLMVTSQSVEGGWYYEPQKPGNHSHEGSITVCIVEALRAARDAGIRVPKESIDLAVEYMKKTYGNGSFAYALGQAPRGSYALSAAGACVLIATGDQSDSVRRMIDECLQYMMGFMPGSGLNPGYYYFYANFYAAQAFHFEGGRDWTRWYKAMKRDLLTSQNIGPNGSTGWWTGQEAASDFAFATGIALMILQMPNEYLPIFQR